MGNRKGVALVEDTGVSLVEDKRLSMTDDEGDSLIEHAWLSPEVLRSTERVSGEATSAVVVQLTHHTQGGHVAKPRSILHVLDHVVVFAPVPHTCLGVLPGHIWVM